MKNSYIPFCMKALKIFCLVGYMIPMCGAYSNQILNVLHNKIDAGVVRAGDAETVDLASIELGTLVFYFSKKPVVSLVPSRDTENDTVNKVSQVFIFPYSDIQGSALLKNIQTINSDIVGLYELKIEKIEKPIKGVRLTCTYDPQKVACKYTFFNSVGRHKGVVFNFYNKDLIYRLKQKEDAVLRVVWGNGKGEHWLWL